MALTEFDNPYEILIRFDETTGALRGAHQQRISGIMRDGVVIQAAPGEPQPLDLADFSASDLMTSTTEAALAANFTLTAENAALEAERDALKAENAALAARVAALEAAPASS